MNSCPCKLGPYRYKAHHYKRGQYDNRAFGVLKTPLPQPHSELFLDKIMYSLV